MGGQELSTPKLFFDGIDWCASTEEGWPDEWICGDGLKEYFHIDECRYIKIVSHKRPGKNRLKVEAHEDEAAYYGIIRGFEIEVFWNLYVFFSEANLKGHCFFDVEIVE